MWNEIERERERERENTMFCKDDEAWEEANPAELLILSHGLL